MKNLPDLFSENPFRELTRLQRQLDRLFGQLTQVEEPSSLWPETKETESHYVVSFDMPGVKRDDIKLRLQDNVLSISAERKIEKGGEISFHAYRQSFTVPSGLKAEQVETDYKDGVLRVAVPKLEAAKGQEIRIGEGKTGFWDRLLAHKKGEKAA